MFKYGNLPESVPKREVERYLQKNGYLIGYEYKGEPVVDKCTFTDIPDGYYMPKKAIVTNPYRDINKTFTIGEDCVIIRNDSYFMGLLPMFNKYAELLCTNEISMYTADILTRAQALLMAGDSNARKQAEIYLKSIEDGKLSFINSNGFSENIKTAEYMGKASTMLTDLIEYEQYLKGSWLMEIGLKSNFNMKREAIMAGEASNAGDELLPLVDDMLENRKLGFDEFNKMFGTNVTVEKNSSWEDVENRESIESEIDAETDDAEKIAEQKGEQKEEVKTDEA
ncbi:MAG: hypothetical protein MJZ20_09460 [Bacteroidaceae bacterium]|nr:hypothetical protein [Bacteroidaceae bacterium]